MYKILMSIVLALMLAVSGAFAANENLFNYGQATGYQPNPATTKRVTADYTATASDHMILVDASTTAINITLPPHSTIQSGKAYIIKKIDATANAVTVTASTADSASNTIGISASRKLTVQQNSILSIQAGTARNWVVRWETPPIQADMYVGTIGSYLGGVKVFKAITASTTLTYADCENIIGVGVDALITKLPPTKAGCSFTFVNTGAAGAAILVINPDDADQIFGTVTLAATVVAIVGAAGDSVSNTKVTSIRGDSMTLVGDGVDGWYIAASTGIWADTN